MDPSRSSLVMKMPQSGKIRRCSFAAAKKAFSLSLQFGNEIGDRARRGAAVRALGADGVLVPFQKFHGKKSDDALCVCALGAVLKDDLALVLARLKDDALRIVGVVCVFLINKCRFIHIPLILR